MFDVLSWQSLPKGGRGRLPLHSGQREEKETCLLVCGCIIKASD